MKKGVILQIPLELLEEDPYNFFETVGSVEIEEKNAELMDSIEEDGKRGRKSFFHHLGCAALPNVPTAA